MASRCEGFLYTLKRALQAAPRAAVMEHLRPLFKLILETFQLRSQLSVSEVPKVRSIVLQDEDETLIYWVNRSRSRLSLHSQSLSRNSTRHPSGHCSAGCLTGHSPVCVCAYIMSFCLDRLLLDSGVDRKITFCHAYMALLDHFKVRHCGIFLLSPVLIFATLVPDDTLSHIPATSLNRPVTRLLDGV